MTYFLEKWQIERLNTRKRRFGTSITAQIREALQKFSGQVAQIAVPTPSAKMCHLTRFSINADFGTGSAMIRQALSAAFAEPDPMIDRKSIKKEMKELDKVISDYFRSYADMAYIMEDENA